MGVREGRSGKQRSVGCLAVPYTARAPPRRSSERTRRLPTRPRTHAVATRPALTCRWPSTRSPSSTPTSRCTRTTRASRSSTTRESCAPPSIVPPRFTSCPPARDPLTPPQALRQGPPHQAHHPVPAPLGRLLGTGRPTDVHRPVRARAGRVLPRRRGWQGLQDQAARCQAGHDSR